MANGNIQSQPPLVWRFDQMPDFLADPSFTGAAEPQRLDEFIARWVQFLSSLWSWHDKASFALRYVSRTGRITAYFVAVPFAAADSPQLEGEVGVLLRTYKLLSGSRSGRATAQAFTADSALPQMVLVRLRQHVSTSLWTTTGSMGGLAGIQQRLDFARQQLDRPPVVYPWAGPSGPFLAPMESLLSQPVACSITTVIQPTQLQPHELTWLASMAQVAQTRSEQNLQTISGGAAVRVADPAAALAGRLYADALSRLSASPFLTTAFCAAENGRLDTAKSLAGAMRSLVHTPLTQDKGKNEVPLPSGADVAVIDSADAESLAQHADMLFQPRQGADLARFPDLVDARGAATLFRLPASVRSGVPGIRVRQAPPDFHPGPRELVHPPRHLQLGNYYSAGPAYMPIDDLRKHALVTGFTGSGKTVTVLQLIHQLWVEHDVPYLVLESAKQEYRGLTTVERIRAKSPAPQVYTLGNELCVPFRLNPFELLPGVRVEAHVSKLQSCFEGAIPPVGPSSSVIAVALLRAYEMHGWSLTDVYPRQGTMKRQFPVLRDFVGQVEQVLQERGYEGEIASNLRAALVGRFQPLLIGGKGRMFESQRSNPPPQVLFRTPTVLEMNDLIIEDKALLVMFLLTMLREWREIDKSQAGELKHVTVVEEAHNVLEETKSEGSGEGATKADTRYKAVQAFCAMLTEIRSLGEGLIIADQSPQKLAKDAIRNTNLQIAHQLRDDDDRQSIARAMIMEKEQQQFVGKLRPGQAALFRTGLEKATFIQVQSYYPEPAQLKAATTPAALAELRSRYRGFGFNALLTDDQLKTYMDSVDSGLIHRRRLSLPYVGCESCAAKCAYRDDMFPWTLQPDAAAESDDWFELADEQEQAKLNITKDQFWDEGVKLGIRIATRAGVAVNPDSVWCGLLHAWNLQLRLRSTPENPHSDSTTGLEAVKRSSCEAAWKRVSGKP